jgi:nucleoside-diphosphate-sugar epimerase
MKIVVTGAAGYIGSKLTERLLNYGHELYCFDNFFFKQEKFVSQLFKHPKCHFFNEDVLFWSSNLKDCIDRADAVYPLAALVGAPLCDQDPDITRLLNSEWQNHLVNHLTNQIVVYCNSNSAYGSNPGVCTEETPMNPLSLYAKTKMEGEAHIHSYRRSVCFRLATVFGASLRPRLDLLVNNLAGKSHIEVFDGHFRRNYIHIDDIVSALEMPLSRIGDMAGEIYNLGNDSINMTKEELVKKICAVTGATWYIVDDRTDPDKRDYEVSSQKLYNLGYRCTRSLEYGIKEMMDLYKTLSEEDRPLCKNY